MVRTTIYLPDDLKWAVEREAATRNMSEAAVIREAIAEVANRSERPKPHGGFLDGDWEPVDWNTNDWLDGFGEP